MNDLLADLAYRWYAKGLDDLTADELEALAEELTAELPAEDPMTAVIRRQLRIRRLAASGGQRSLS